MLIAATLAAATAAHAHESVSPDWCASGQRVLFDQFHFDAGQLTAAIGVTPLPPCVGICGEPDDYRLAGNVGLSYCGGGGYDPRSGPVHAVDDIGEIVAVVQGPPQFLGDDHHTGYLASSGLWGICLRCEAFNALPPARPSLPGTPVPSR